MQRIKHEAIITQANNIDDDKRKALFEQVKQCTIPYKEQKYLAAKEADFVRGSLIVVTFYNGPNLITKVIPRFKSLHIGIFPGTTKKIPEYDGIKRKDRKEITVRNHVEICLLHRPGMYDFFMEQPEDGHCDLFILTSSEPDSLVFAGHAIFKSVCVGYGNETMTIGFDFTPPTFIGTSVEDYVVRKAKEKLNNDPDTIADFNADFLLVAAARALSDY